MPFLTAWLGVIAVAVAIEQHAGEQARLASSCAGVALGGVAGELCLNRIPQRLIDDRRVFAGMGLPLVNDLAEIGAVLQYQVERTAREWLAADERDPKRSSTTCF